MSSRLQLAFDLAVRHRLTDPTSEDFQPHSERASATVLRERFEVGKDLPEEGCPPEEVIQELSDAAGDGLVRNTDPRFFSWVMGGSDLTGVAADWLCSAWGQNAALYQCSPASAICEEACSHWLLQALHLPPTCGVGFVSGATMAAFTSLAAARDELLLRKGHRLEDGLQGPNVPCIRIFICQDAHVTNYAALRFLGLGETNIVRVSSTEQGVFNIAELESSLSKEPANSPILIIGQAGHINSGAFDDFVQLAELAKRYEGWLHADGAFGLFSRVRECNRIAGGLAHGLDLADSWSCDGHKWLQCPYDSGFAIVRNIQALNRSMDMSASYLTHDPEDGRNPCHFNPELSRRARSFAVWAILKSLGRAGVEEMVSRHCSCAAALAASLEGQEGISVCNRVVLNQLVVRFGESDQLTIRVIEELNATGKVFFRNVKWRGVTMMRVSIISKETNLKVMEEVATLIRETWTRVSHSE